MQVVEDQSFIYADILYDEGTKQYGYVIATFQADHRCDIGPLRSGFSSPEEARHAAFLEYVEQTSRQPSRQSSRQKSPPLAQGWRLLIWWVGLSASAYLLAALLRLVVSRFLFPHEIGETSASIVGVQVIIALRFLEGLGIGIIQWLVLRRAFPNMRWQGWVLVTTISIFLSQFIQPLLYFTFLRGISPTGISGVSIVVAEGIIAPAAIGAAQYLILTRYVDRAGWWIAASAAAGLIMSLIKLLIYAASNTWSMAIDESFIFGSFVDAVASSVGAIWSEPLAPDNGLSHILNNLVV